jgi:hypothetical protein
MATAKSRIVCVSGAFCGFYAYISTSDALKQQGYEVLAVSLPSVGARPSHESFAQEVAAIHEAAMGPIIAGKDVVLVVHSWAGVPGSEAMNSLGKVRARRKSLGAGW